MQQNHWYMEIYAKDVQQRRMHEAELARRVAAAAPARIPAGFVGRMVRSVASWGRGIWSPAAAGEPLPSAAGELALSGVERATVKPLTASLERIPRHTDPYAGMAIVARGAAFLTLEEPSGVRDY